MSTRSVLEYTLLARAELLCNWPQQQPSNQSATDSGVTREVGRAHYTGGKASDFISAPWYAIVVWVAFKMVHPVYEKQG
jgi:hypothetical protein